MAVCPNGHDSASDDFCDVCGMRIGGSPATGPSPVASVPPPWPDTGGRNLPPLRHPQDRPVLRGLRLQLPGSPFHPRWPAAGRPFSRPGQPSSPRPRNPSDLYSPSRPLRPPAPSAEAAPSAPSARSAPSVPSVPPSPSMSSFPYPQATWTAVVGADRAYYERVQALTGPEGAAVTFPSYCAERRFQLVGNQMRIGRRSVSRGLAPEIDLTGPPADPGISRLHAVLIATPDGSWAVLDPGSANGTLVNGSEIGTGDQVPLHDGDRINLGAWTAITVHRG